MDHFGIGNAMKSSARIYSQTARLTGRTTSLIESLKTGDRVIFLHPEEAVRVRTLCAQRGVAIDCITLPVNEVYRAFERGTSEGRTLFDHSWIEQFYMRHFDLAAEEIDYLQRELSGQGTALDETPRAAFKRKSWPAF